MSAQNWYNLALFGHVVGVLGMAAAYTIDTVGLAGLRRSSTGEEARAWFVTRRWVLLTGPPTIILVLVSGIYMMVTQWGLVPWILVALASLVAIAVVGGVLTGIPMARVTPALQQVNGPLPDELRRALRNPVLTLSVNVRVAVTLAIVFLMVLKPGWFGSVLAIGIGSAGAVIAAPLLGRAGGGAH